MILADKKQIEDFIYHQLRCMNFKSDKIKIEPWYMQGQIVTTSDYAAGNFVNDYSIVTSPTFLDTWLNNVYFGDLTIQPAMNAPVVDTLYSCSLKKAWLPSRVSGGGIITENNFYEYNFLISTAFPAPYQTDNFKHIENIMFQTLRLAQSTMAGTQIVVRLTFSGWKVSMS